MNQKEILEKIEGYIELKEKSETSPLEAIGRVNAKEMIAQIDIPNFSKSIYDGYTLHEEDYIRLLQGETIALSIGGRIGAGHFPDKELCPGTTFHIMSGTEVPKNTRYVVPCEDIKMEDNRVFIEEINSQKKTIVYKGEKSKKGDVIGKKDTIIDRNVLFSITNQGYDKVYIYNRPKVAIISTGDEVKPIGTSYERATIYDSTSYAIAADVIMNRGEVIGIDHAGDDINSILKVINKWLDQSDIIVTTGGIAKGKYDYTKDIHNYLSTNIIFSELDKAPRVIVSKLKNKWIINVSGSPRATFISLDYIIIPILRKMMGLDFK